VTGKQLCRNRAISETAAGGVDLTRVTPAASFSRVPGRSGPLAPWQAPGLHPRRHGRLYFL